jgi:hypothetical protein
MNAIDWSKAPPHATHWCPGNAKIEAGWIYNPGGTKGEFYSCYADRGLEHIPAFPDWRKSRLVQRPPKQHWTGEGLPPVGTVCEWHPNHDGWVQVEILGRSGEETWFRRDGHESSETCLRMAFFRPIRTPEQIAAEEREKARDEVLNAMAANMALEKNETLWQHRLQVVGEMLDMGYRKQVAP